MKAVVVEINNNHAAVLSDDGCITTIKNENYVIGQVIQVRNSKITFTKQLTAFAASAAAVVLLGTGSWAYASPYTYVSVDVNPSIEFTLNRFDRVIKVNAVNDDGKDIINDIAIDELTNDSIEAAIIKTVDQISDAGYFSSETEGGIVITTSSDNTDKAEELAKELETTVEKETSDLSNNVIIEAFSVGKERLQEAQNLGVTPGKLSLVEKLIESSEDSNSINLEDWLNKSVKDIMKATKENKSKLANESVQDNNTSTITEEAKDQNSLDDDALNEEQLVEKAEKAAERAQKQAEKSAQKAKLAQAKAEKKAQEAAIAKENEKKEADNAAKQAQLEAKEAEKAAKEASKAADKAKKDAEKVKKDAEKAKKTGKHTTGDNKNTGSEVVKNNNKDKINNTTKTTDSSKSNSMTNKDKTTSINQTSGTSTDKKNADKNNGKTKDTAKFDSKKDITKETSSELNTTDDTIIKDDDKEKNNDHRYNTRVSSKRK